MAMMDFEMTGDEDLYKIFESEGNYEYDTSNTFRKLLESSQGSRQKTPMRLGTSSGFQRQDIQSPNFRPITGFKPESEPLSPGTTNMRPGTANLRPGTASLRSGNMQSSAGLRPVTGRPKTSKTIDFGLRPGTGFKPGTGARPGTSSEVNRPMTAVRGAGYTSNKMFDPLNEAAVASDDTEKQDESVEEKIKQLESRIMQDIEESMVASSEKRIREGLDKAKEASSKERALIRLQEQAGLGDSHNLDLTYSVLYNLANQYATNDLNTEALSTYQLITRNRMFSNSHRLKVNIGNLYFRQGHFHKAVKMYRMALDQVPSSQKTFRIKIMHNIGMVFVRMGQYEDAIASLEYIMSEKPNHQSGLHLILCYYALEDREKMKNAMNLLLNVPLEYDNEEKYKTTSEDATEKRITEAKKKDILHKYEQKLKSDAEYCIMTAAKLISPVIEDTFGDGYEWCVQAIKSSGFSQLAADLEINKAVMYLRQNQVQDATDTLKVFEKKSTMLSSAALNLSFICYLQGDYENAKKYGEIVTASNVYSSGGFVNLGASAVMLEDLNTAKNCFHSALERDPTNFEALFNLGLVYKRQGMYSEAMECFQKFTGSLSLLPEVLYQMASVLELLGDSEAAADLYQQLLGLAPSDSGILQRLGQLHDHEGEKQQAYHYQQESFRYYPSNLNVINWLGSYFIELQVAERAQVYFEKAAIMQPMEPKWRLMVAGCHRRTGNLHRALTLYQDIHHEFPESIECLRFLVRLCTDLNMREAGEYALELKKLEKNREMRERVSSSRPGTASRRSGSSISSRSAISPVPAIRTGSPMVPLRNRTTKLAALRDSLDSEEFSYTQQSIDVSYSDPLGPMTARPRTSVGRNIDDDFGDEALGDDLLPE